MPNIEEIRMLDEVPIQINFIDDGEIKPIDDATVKEIWVEKPDGTPLKWTAAFLTDGTDGSIVYMLTNYTSYKYTIIECEVSPELIGLNMTLDIPEPPMLYKTETSYYNAHFYPKIGKETFNHTIGQPWTYPNSTETIMQVPNQWRTVNRMVGQGSGKNYVVEAQ